MASLLNFNSIFFKKVPTTNCLLNCFVRKMIFSLPNYMKTTLHTNNDNSDDRVNALVESYKQLT